MRQGALMAEHVTEAIPTALFQTERQREILTQTVQEGRVEVAELA